MNTWDRLIEVLILLTLWVEFYYDAWWNNRPQRIKRRHKEKFNYETLTEGEMK